MVEKCGDYKRQAQQANEKSLAEADARSRLVDSNRRQNEEIEHLVRCTVVGRRHFWLFVLAGGPPFIL